MTGSKSVIELRSKYSPSGSYTTIMIFFNKNKTVEKMPESDNDCLTFFDNNQIMARNWNVSYNWKPLVSVITTMVALFPPQKTEIQKTSGTFPHSMALLR
jgi:hypothetical protein